MQTSETLPVIFIILSFLVILPLFWCGVVYLISRFGWNQLAASFATHQPMPSDLQTGSGMINFTRYNSTLLFKADDRGLWLKTMVLFSSGHKPLFIPWSAVEHHEGKESFWGYQTKLKVKGITIRLHQNLSRWLGER